MIAQSSQGTKSPFNEHVSPMTMGKGILVSYIITIPCFFVFAFITTYTSFPEKLITPAVVITTIISILVASSISTRNLRSRGWLNGSLVGLVYMVILYLLSSIIFSNFVIDRYVITMAVIGILTGTIGGVLGINVKRPSRKRARAK